MSTESTPNKNEKFPPTQHDFCKAGDSGSSVLDHEGNIAALVYCAITGACGPIRDPVDPAEPFWPPPGQQKEEDEKQKQKEKEQDIELDFVDTTIGTSCGLVTPIEEVLEARENRGRSRGGFVKRIDYGTLKVALV